MTVHLVDQHLVAPESVAALFRLVHDVGVPMMEAAGASFVSCERGPELGDDVEVLSVWAVIDFVEWNRIRRNLMFDPRYHAYSAELAGLRNGGTRRFYTGEPVAASPADAAPPDDGGPAIRRWEMFSIALDAPAPARERLRRAMRDCDRFIPGITRCAVGTNTATSPVEFVWETTYASVGAYASTYMSHPYHAALLDRFLLPDCPERITTANELGAGLIGYTVDPDRPLGPVAVRRLLLLDFADAAAAEAATRAVAAKNAGWSESILAENTMATRWFDGETDLGGRPAWSHVWDQCFTTVDQYEAHRERNGAAAPIEADIIGRARRTAEVVYVPEER